MAFSEDIVDELLLRLSDGESLVTIAQDPRMPSRETVRRWCASDEAFRAKYASAREAQADAIFDEVQAIADTATPENVAVARLQIDARKWMAGKLRPKVYGEKITAEHTGEGGGPAIFVLRDMTKDG
jgi:hypothetical protein